MDRALVDTDILSEFLRGKNAEVRRRASEYLRQHGRLTLSVITIFEVVRGRHQANQPDRALQFLSWPKSAEVLPFDASCAVRAGELAGAMHRAGTMLAIADVLIAATALAYDLVVVTGNTQHYARLAPLGLRLENWR
jgi:tRNA(fMet)-specific endonuclease VapC